MPDGPSPVFSNRDSVLQAPLPAKLAALGPRQREIAAIVYTSTAATPRDVQARLSEPRSVRVVRTLLDRMVVKGLVKRRQSGRHNEVIYLAAIATPRVKEAAVKRLVDEQFGGSLIAAAEAIAALVRRQSQTPRTSVAVRRMVND